ncbi:MAG: DUF447 domain-containing protein [Candidatus Natronoplasma sp.]
MGLKEKMVYHEGILVSTDEKINAAAVGAEIEGSKLKCRIYRPSDTAENLEVGVRFTYSLTDDLSLFFKAALTGRDEPGLSELSEDEIRRKENFFYPEEATEVFFCKVEEVWEKKIRDEYGSARLKHVVAEIQSKETLREAAPLNREESLLDAMVHASRLPIVDGEQKRTIRKKIDRGLASVNLDPESREGKIKNKIIDFVEKWS